MSEEYILRKKLLEYYKRKFIIKEEGCDKGVQHADKGKFIESISKCKIVLADFWAAWCGPCWLLEPIINEIAKKYTPRIEILKINVGENISLARKFNVLSIPTVIIFKSGKEYKRFIGFNPRLTVEIRNVIEELLRSN